MKFKIQPFTQIIFFNVDNIYNNVDNIFYLLVGHITKLVRVPRVKETECKERFTSFC